MTKQELIDQLNHFQAQVNNVVMINLFLLEDSENEVCDDAYRLIRSFEQYIAEGIETFIMDRVEPDYDSTLRNPSI